MRGVREDPHESLNSVSQNQVGQLAWEPVDVPTESLGGSRHFGSATLPASWLLFPQTPLNVWAPSPLLSSVCLLPYLETMQDSFKLCAALPQCSSCHVPLHHCGLLHYFNSFHGSFHAVS